MTFFPILVVLAACAISALAAGGAFAAEPTRARARVESLRREE